MTTPTPAGWYPDPDGSGGQRYWDGNSWTDHRAPPAPTPPPAQPPAPAEPVEPVLPAQPPANEEPTSVVHLRAVPTETRVGAHRKPDPEDEPAEPEPSESDSYAQKTEPVSQRLTPDVPPPPLAAVPSPPQVDPAPFDITPSQSGPFPAAPAFGAPTAGPSNGNRSLLIRYGAACAALFVVLIGLAVYGFLIKKDPEVQLSTPGGSEITTEASPDSGPGSWGEPTTTAAESPTAATAPASAGEATDGPLSFTVNGMEIGPTVAMTDAPIEKTAVGEFIVLHMNVANPGPERSTFIATFQTLHAGGTTYQVDDGATAYLGGTFADLPPGASQVVSIAFDVPPGTVPEFIELHVDPTTAGVQVPLP